MGSSEEERLVQMVHDFMESDAPPPPTTPSTTGTTSLHQQTLLLLEVFSRHLLSPSLHSMHALVLQ